MKKSRKILSILLCLVAVLSFTVGCSKTNAEDKVIKVGATQVPGGDLFEYLKDHSDKKIEKYYVDIRDIIAENVCNGVFDCDNAYLYGYKLQGFMTGLCGMGYSLLRDIKKDLPCVIALEV